MMEQSAEAMPMEVDPSIKPNSTTKFLVEFDRELAPGWALKVRGISSRARDLTEEVAFYDPESPGLVKFIYMNFELKRRTTGLLRSS